MNGKALDILAIIVIAVFLIILSETNKMHVVTDMPFLSIYMAYIIGRWIGKFTSKNKNKTKTTNELSEK